MALRWRCPRGTDRGKRRLRIAKQGHLRALTDVIPRYEFTDGAANFSIATYLLARIGGG